VGIEVVTQPGHQLPARGRVGQQRQPAARAERGEVERVVQTGGGQHGAEHRLARRATPLAEQRHGVDGVGGPSAPGQRRLEDLRVHIMAGPE
jgi:hypothetical protein